MSLRTEQGQATVEAAFSIPILFTLLLMLIQPGIILYDRMLMNHAAAEGCRLLATRSAQAGLGDAQCMALIKRQLAAIPPHNLFHIHAPSCSWDIQLMGSDTANQVSVTIKNKLKLLPLFDTTGAVLGIADSEGCIAVEVTQHAQTQPAWVQEGSLGLDPALWVSVREGED